MVAKSGYETVMRKDHRISVIIPARNEEESIGAVLDHVPAWVDECIVVDNGSRDGTAAVAAAHNALVVRESEAGYGAACLAGIAASHQSGPSDILVFLDADFSDDPTVMNELVDPLIDGNADLVIGNRTSTPEGRQALSVPQRWGNTLACLLIRMFWQHRYHDLGPFRAIRRSALLDLEMSDRNYGWTVEMQVRAVKKHQKICEVPMPYRQRLAGRSKISGTLSGVIRAGSKILYIIFREVVRPCN